MEIIGTVAVGLDQPEIQVKLFLFSAYNNAHIPMQHRTDKIKMWLVVGCEGKLVLK